MTGAKWQDLIFKEEIAERCVLKEIQEKIGQRRLQWFGHVRREGGRSTEDGRGNARVKTKDNMETSCTQGQENAKNRGGPSNRWNERKEDHCKL